MTLFALSGLAIAITSFPLAVLVLVHNRKNRLNLIWAFFALCVAIWGIGAYKVGISKDIDSALFWWRFTHVGVILIPVLFLHFVHRFLELKSRLLIYLSYLLGLLFLYANTTPYFISNMRYVFDSFYYDSPPSFLYKLFVLFFFISVIYSHYLLFLQYNYVSERKQAQILYFFFATLVGFLGGSTSFLPVFQIDIYPILNFTVPLYPLIMTYAIIKHELFNVRVIAAELLVIGITISLSVELFFSETSTEIITRSILLSLVILFGYFLIRSVLREIRLREQIAKLADDLKKANLELKKLDQLKSEFVSLASHQLRTPLTVIKGYISMIQEGSFGKVPAELEDALRKIYTSNERLINLVGDFLNLSRIESGRMKYAFMPTSVEEITKSVYEEFIEVAKERKLKLSYDEPADPLPQAMIDKDKFRQVIMNLVDNSMKYTPSGSVKIKIEEENSKDGKNILISVSDTGIGMAEDDLNSIFKRFSRGEEGSKTNTGGLGLGLYLAKRIVTDHGGEIWATSDGAGKGSTFWVRVPARADETLRENQFGEFISKM